MKVNIIVHTSSMAIGGYNRIKKLAASISDYNTCPKLKVTLAAETQELIDAVIEEIKYGSIDVEKVEIV